MPSVTVTGLLATLVVLLWRINTGFTLEAFDNPMPSHMLMPVSLGSDHVRVKRQTALEMNQPFRVLPVYAENFNENLGSKADSVQNEIIPNLLDFLQQSLSVAPLSGPILLNNNCTSTAILRDLVTGHITCGQQCAPTFCGFFQVPAEHLKQCLQCNTAGLMVTPSDCVVGSPAEDGAGVADYDFVLYITAEDTNCQSEGAAQTVAFATSCQNEMRQDRPVAGAINFCPEGVRNRDPDFAFAVSKHEIMHAMGFSNFLFALWRDSATNEPRTPRLPSSGLPARTQTGSFAISRSTVDTVTYDDWVTSAGTIPHQVTRLVTPAIREEARRHFDCAELAGVELENQGSAGTMGSHWEKRVLGNEAMTGQLTFNPVFSRFTFAALEDSGWYTVNYSLADNLIWGQGAGCRFAEGSCGEWIAMQIASDQSPSPFCNVLESSSPVSLSCTVDREAVSRCNLIPQAGIPTEYEYFDTDSEVGGRVTIADYCPFQDVFNFRNVDGTLRGTTCSVAANVPPGNTLLESYGPGARCITHGRQWTVNNQAEAVYGGGCYQYSCTDDEVTITVGNQQFTCGCSQAGQERVLDMLVSGVRYEGSIICPPCGEICHAASKGIVLGESSGGVILPNQAPPTHNPTPYLLLTVALFAVASLVQ